MSFWTRPEPNSIFFHLLEESNPLGAQPRAQQEPGGRALTWI